MDKFSKTKLSLFTWAMFPIYAWQGLRIRANVERLIPKKMPRTGKIGKKETHFKILTIGDSTIESLGADTFEETFSYNIAHALHKRSGQTVEWRSVGGNSGTSENLRDHLLPHIEDRDFTHVIIAVGTNDVKNFHTVPRFKRDFGTLLYALRARFPEAKIIWSPVADLTKFPIMPKQLGKILAARATLINAMGKELCEERGAIYSEPIPIESTEGFATDGFHAGPAGNQIWGEHLTNYILALEPQT